MHSDKPPDLEDNRADALLAVRCQLGERTAFDDLIRRWALPLRAYIGRVAGRADVADELMQDIWLRVLQGIGRLKDPTRLRAWLFSIAHRRMMDRLREQYLRPSGSVADADLPEPDPAHPDRELQARELELGLARLPAMEREVLSLFYLDELSLAEVAQVLALPLGTVKSRLFRARKLLRHELSGE